MQIVINGDNVHEMSNQNLWKNKKNNIGFSSAKYSQVKETMLLL